MLSHQGFKNPQTLELRISQILQQVQQSDRFRWYVSVADNWRWTASEDDRISFIIIVSDFVVLINDFLVISDSDLLKGGGGLGGGGDLK